MLARSPEIQKEQFRSFDPLASVDRCRFDILTLGYVLPETMQQVQNEELTYIAEGINRPLYTKFLLEQRDGELVFFNWGKWVPYISTLERGHETALQEAAEDSRKTFAAERTAEDLLIGYRLHNLRPGQTMAWNSVFPDRECQAYGEAFVGSLGYQPKRRMGFLYFAERLADGSLELHTQSVDNSDLEAFEAAMAYGEHGITVMRERYDEVLASKYGNRYYAGRDVEKQLGLENAWDIILKHKDLVNYYIGEICKLAAEETMPRDLLEEAKKRLTYGVWASLKERLDAAYSPAPTSRGYVPAFNLYALQQEVSGAFDKLSKRGEVLFGCGGALRGEGGLMNASSDEVLSSIFGGKNEVLKCVTCPLCKRSGVDAHIRHETDKKTITCSKCKQSKVYAK